MMHTDIQGNTNNLLDDVKQMFEDHDERHELDMATDEKFDWVNTCDAKQHSAPLPTSQVDLFKFLCANYKHNLLKTKTPQLTGQGDPLRYKRAARVCRASRELDQIQRKWSFWCTGPATKSE